MAASIQDKTRRVIPQWRTVATTGHLRELDSLLPLFHERGKNLGTVEERLREWKEHQSPAFAAEAVAAATMAGAPELAVDAANFILAWGSQIQHPVRWLARQVLSPSNEGGGSDHPEVNRIRYLRTIVKHDPRNAIRWAELAREYAIVGLLYKAISCMTVAVQLAPDTRYVVRSAARLFVHAGDPERARSLLLRARGIETDPWIAAAEIAVSSVLGQSSEYIKTGRRLLESSRFSPHHTSELASALATVEIDAGSVRQAKKHLRSALIDPNPNSVGQVRWAQTQVDFELTEAKLDIERAFEARAWQNYYAANWDRALAEAREWQDDEPYSSRPPTLASYLAAAIKRDYKLAIQICDQGLAANPSDPTLLNNLVYSLIGDENFVKAEALMARFDSMDLNQIEAPVKAATQGLLEFRMGRPESGRRLYHDAIRQAQIGGHEVLVARAATYLAVEEARIRSQFAEESRLRAIDLARKIPQADLAILLREL